MSRRARKQGYPRHERKLPEFPAGDQSLRVMTLNGKQVSAGHERAMLALIPPDQAAEAVAILTAGAQERAALHRMDAVIWKDAIGPAPAISTARSRRRERRGYQPLVQNWQANT